DLYPSSRLYFGGGLTPQALLDFMVWRREADRLGIHLTPADIRQKIEKETFGQLNQSDFDRLQMNLATRGPGGVDIATALADEFRVRLAQLAVLGYDPGTSSRVPALITPYEFWEFYRKNRTEVSIRFLEIPVEHYLSQIKEKPSDEDLRALHEKYKNDEYAPDKETPGFKLPRRIKVEWVSASPDSDYYKKAAGQWILSTVAGIPSDPWLATALLPVPVLREYSEQAQFGRLRLPPWTERDFATSLYSYAYLQRPQSAASVVGQIGGAVSTAVGPQGGLLYRLTPN